MSTTGRGTSHGPCCLSPYHQVWYFWLYWVLSALCGGIWVQSWAATCRTCGMTFPRPNISRIKSRIASPTRSQKSSVSSWSEALCEQSRSQVETVLPAATGPCAPIEPVPFSSGLAVTSEHAVISGFSAESSAPVQGTSCVDRAVLEKTRVLHISQGLNPMWARSMYMLVILELNWCLGPRTLAERNVTLRRSSAIPKRSRKLNGMRNANSLHNLRSAMKPLSIF